MSRYFALLVLSALTLSLLIPDASRAAEGDVLSPKTHVFWLQGDANLAKAIGYEEIVEPFVESRPVDSFEPRLEVFDEAGAHLITVPVDAPGVSTEVVNYTRGDELDVLRLASQTFDLRVAVPSLDGVALGDSILRLEFVDPITLVFSEIAIPVVGFDPETVALLRPPRLPDDAKVQVLLDNSGSQLPGMGGWDIVFLGDGFTAAEEQFFYSQSSDYLMDLLSREPWATLHGLLRVRAVFRPSVDSGIANGWDWASRDNNTVYGAFVIEEWYRGVCPVDYTGWSERVQADRIAAGADFAILIGNLRRYMGCTDMETEAFVGIGFPQNFRHEMFHTARIFEEDKWPCSEYCYPEGSSVEIFHNLTFDSYCPKWSEWLGAGAECNACTIGCSNVYHPGEACGMSTGHQFNELCPVCQEANAVRILDSSTFAWRRAPLGRNLRVLEGTSVTFTLGIMSIPHTIQWSVNSEVKATSGASFDYPFFFGSNEVTAEVTLDTAFVAKAGWIPKTKKTFSWVVDVDPRF